MKPGAANAAAAQQTNGSWKGIKLADAIHQDPDIHAALVGACQRSDEITPGPVGLEDVGCQGNRVLRGINGRKHGRECLLAVTQRANAIARQQRTAGHGVAGMHQRQAQIQLIAQGCLLAGVLVIRAAQRLRQRLNDLACTGLDPVDSEQHVEHRACERKEQRDGNPAPGGAWVRQFEQGMQSGRDRNQQPAGQRKSLPGNRQQSIASSTPGQWPVWS